MILGNLFNIAQSTKSLSGVISQLNPVGGLLSAISGGFSGNQGDFSSNQGPRANTGNSFSFESVAATLTPFQYPIESISSRSHPLNPILQTGGLIFPYNPTITEGVNVKYDQIELAHTNESYFTYRGTENVRINISDAVWTCDTLSNAIYALSVLHFFRSYSLMDFGRFKSGRPPSPMWFSAYGNYAFNRVPCFLEKADWSFPNDIDSVGIPEPGTPEFERNELQTNRSASGKYTWIPSKFTVSSISLIVQHSPEYWTNFSLEDYYSGQMLTRGGSFHATNPAQNQNIFGSNGGLF